MIKEQISFERYSRQVALPELGEAGQQKLLNAKVLVAGAGGLGSVALQYLAAAGVGTIGIVDDDIVSLHNLHRQPLFSMEDLGASKATVAAQRLHALNPDVQLLPYNERLGVNNALRILADYDVVLDGTDNFATRYMINDACVLLRKPLIYGAVSKYEGQVAVFNAVLEGEARSTNYRDLFPQPPAPGEVANCAETGVLGVLPGLIGTMQAGEVIKLVTGIGTPLVNTLFTYNALNNQVFQWQLTAREGAAELMPRDAESFKMTDYQWLCGITESSFDIDKDTFDKLCSRKEVTVIDVREPGEWPAVSEFQHMQIPLGQLADNMQNLPGDTIVVFCQSGKRSLQAANLLAREYGQQRKIYSLAGGIVSWKKQNTIK